MRLSSLCDPVYLWPSVKTWHLCSYSTNLLYFNPNPDLPSAKATVNLILWKFFFKKCGTHVSWAQGLPGFNLLYFSQEGTPLIIPFNLPLKMQTFTELKWVHFFKRLLLKQCSSTLANLCWFHPKLIMNTEWYLLQPASSCNTGVGQSHTAEQLPSQWREPWYAETEH